MRVVFMGTPDFAVTALQALHAAGHEITAVYSQPPRPAGRGRQPRPSPVQAWAEAAGLPVRTPVGLKDADAQAAFAALQADVAAVAAYGVLLPPPVLAAPRLGCLNVHASLLPRWRGAAPIQRAILAGDTETGVTIMQMESGLDTGPMLLRAALSIAADATAGTLHDALAAQGARLIVEALAKLPALTAEPQPAEGVTYAAKIDKAESRLDFTAPAALVDRQVRAFTPWPGAWCRLPDGTRLRILAGAVVAGGGGMPGTVLDDRLTIACGAGAYRPNRMQPAGKAAMDGEAYLRGRPVPAGTLLDSGRRR